MKFQMKRRTSELFLYGKSGTLFCSQNLATRERWQEAVVLMLEIFSCSSDALLFIHHCLYTYVLWPALSVSVSVCLPVCPSVCLCLSVCLSLSLGKSPPLPLSFVLFVSLCLFHLRALSVSFCALPLFLILKHVGVWDFSFSFLFLFILPLNDSVTHLRL